MIRSLALTLAFALVSSGCDVLVTQATSRDKDGADAAPRPLRASEVEAEARSILFGWRDAQNRDAPEVWSAFYEPPSFDASLPGQSAPRTFDFEAWSARQRELFARQLRVDVEKPAFATWLAHDAGLGDGIVQVTFVKRWRTTGHEEHGRWRLHMKLGADRQLRIVHEEQLSAIPGWEDRTRTEFDASDLVAPVSIQTAWAPLANGSPERSLDSGVSTARLTRLTITLTGADGKKRTFVVTDDPDRSSSASSVKALSSGALLYDEHRWAAGAGERYAVLKEPNSIKVLRRILRSPTDVADMPDEHTHEGDDGDKRSHPWMLQQRIALPHGALLTR
ncbi:hypothetical protein AKJ09_06110 [Labilithrix luteola]|uniref:Lipoprotein n=1 Tax=Labilithrix luteola TaxID=1391654 RepID=A0A0K1Q1D5_9BACT|nr:hypothetical protein [Labilithrix luteola]AKU99446.1 hypothetical protein AKJ09_06110 [Labilithrix luteola]